MDSKVCSMLMRGHGAWLMFLLILATPSAAAAQSHAITVGVGYQALRFDELSFPLGFHADLGAGFDEHVSVVGEFGWARESVQQFGLRDITTGLHLAGGGRWDFSPSHRLRAFGQILVGVERNKTDIEKFGSVSTSAFLLQPGGGIGFRIRGRQDLFGEVDLHRTTRQGESANAVRVVVGVRVRIP